MKLGLDIDLRQATQAFAAHAKQIPFATAIALNRTAEEVNKAIRDNMLRRFHIRERQLLRFVAPIPLRREQRARKDQLSVELRTEGIGRILNPFQIGQPKTARDRLTPVAIPTRELRFNDMTRIPRRWYPQNLGLTPRRDPSGQQFFALGRNAIRDKKTPFKRTASGAVQIKGKLRTFVLDPAHHKGLKPSQWGVYIRIGPEPQDIRMLWRFTMRVRRPRILEFYETVGRVARNRFGVNFRGALALALRTAR